MGILDAATNAASTASNVLSNAGPATGLSGITDAVSGGLSAVGNALTSLFGGTAGVKLPLPNILSDYASYDYIISLSALSTNDVNYPDSSYMIGKPLKLICKSANIDPNNRVQTSYGKFDFFIDNLNIESVIGMQTPKATNVTTIQFDIIEPYSMNIFMLALQQAADAAGHGNWRDAPFLLTIEFRGNKENGLMLKIPAIRHIPVRLTTVLIKVNEQGTTYNVNAFAIPAQALTSQFANLKSEVSIRGKTVQEVLQTGEQSLQAVVNKKLKQYETDGVVAKADEIIILFPTEIASAMSLGAALPGDVSLSATATPGVSASSIYKKLGVTTSNVNYTSVQAEQDCNALGRSSMGYDQSRKGDQSTCKESESYEIGAGIWVRGKMTVNVNEGTLRFAQDADIPTIINQVMLLSKYPETALSNSGLDGEGMRTWWRIDTQVYYVESKENLKKTGVYPRILVYRVIPYTAHASRNAAQNVRAPGFENFKVVKEYNYIYTGKNTEVLKFNIDFNVNFSNVLAADAYKRNMDVVRNRETGNKNEEVNEIGTQSNGVKPSNKEGAVPTQQKYTMLGSFFDWVGGGGKETYATRAAKVWHKAITNDVDMMILNMDIMGDPYWIADSGQGNYTAAPYPGVRGLNTNGTVNWQSGEVPIKVNFRSPLDINQATGMYSFKANSFSPSSSSVTGWSGFYCVQTVTSSFRSGVFRQTLSGFRYPAQESTVLGTPDQTQNTSIEPETEKVEKLDYDAEKNASIDP